jgi:hypothetical protein
MYIILLELILCMVDAIYDIGVPTFNYMQAKLMT